MYVSIKKPDQKVKVIPSHLCSITPQLDNSINLWGSHHKEDIDLLQCIQRRPQRCPEGWRLAEAIAAVQPGEGCRELRDLSST